MDIQQLKYFSEICKCGSFSKAAENLYISQQGLSMAITRLETELSCRLFRRTSKGIFLTEDGEYLLRECHDILERFEACEHHFHSGAPKEQPVNIAATYGALAEFAAELILQFREEHPDVNVSVREYYSVICDEMVESESVDLGFSLNAYDKKKFEGVTLFETELCLLAHRDHPLFSKEVIAPSDVDRQPLIIVDDNLFKCSRGFLQECKKAGVKPDVRFRVGEISNVFRLVAENKGLGLAARTVSNVLSSPNVKAIPFENNYSWRVSLIRKKGRPLSAGAKLFERYAVRSIQTQAGGD